MAATVGGMAVDIMVAEVMAAGADAKRDFKVSFLISSQY
jgi:hypothetical protein